jgi:hypothetical protein
MSNPPKWYFVTFIVTKVVIVIQTSIMAAALWRFW